MNQASKSMPNFQALLSLQTPLGAFPSEVLERVGAKPLIDETAFVTAQVVLILAHLASRIEGGERLRPALNAALDFIETCESVASPGSFSFYSRNPTAQRLAIDISPDADDTSLCWAALVLGERRPREDARQALARHLIPICPAARQRGDPSWIRAGGFRTWLGDMPSNPVDLCVNANIVFAAYVCGLGHSPITRGAVETIRAGLGVTGGDPSFQHSITPYYAHPAELSYAMNRAVAAGARELKSEALRLAQFDREDRNAGRPPSRPLYCNAHGRPVWRSEALQLARRILDAGKPTSLVSPLLSYGDNYDLHASLGA